MSDRASTAPGQRRPRPGADQSLVTARDLELLAFAAEHRLVLAAHAQALLGVGESVAYRRLGALTAKGLLEHSRVLHGQPGWYQITRGGLALIGSRLPPPRIDLRSYRHDIGIAWLWLAAARGGFGPVDRIVSERAMRSNDGARAAPGQGELGPPYGVRLGGVGPGGLPRLHYPDLLLLGPGSARVAIELELSGKGRRRLETIVAGYGADASVTTVLYLAEKAAIRREVRSAAARLGISEIVRVQRYLSPAPLRRSANAANAAERTREPTRSALAR